MTQNSDSYEGIPLCWSFRNVFLYLKLDSQNKVFRFAFKVPDAQQEAFEVLKGIIQNKNVDYLCEHLIELCQKNIIVDETEHEHRQWHSYQKSLFQLREALFKVKGELPWTPFVSQLGKELDPHNLICTCIGIQKSDLVDYFRIHKGDKKDFIRMTNATMTCSQCAMSLEQEWSKIAQDSLFVDKINRSEFMRKLNLALNEFKSFTHLDLSNIKLEILDLKDSILCVSVSCPEADQAIDENSVLNNSVIENALVNYLNGHLQLKLKVMVVSIS